MQPAALDTKMKRNEGHVSSSISEEAKSDEAALYSNATMDVLAPSSQSDLMRLFRLLFVETDGFVSFANQSFPALTTAESEERGKDGYSDNEFWNQVTEAFRNDETTLTSINDGFGSGSTMTVSQQLIDPSFCMNKSATPHDLFHWYRSVERASLGSISTLPVEEESEDDITTEQPLPLWRATPIVEPVLGIPKKVLVTGGAGFIASHVADKLLARGDSVVIVDEMNDYYDLAIKESNLQMLSNKYGSDRLTIYRGDICDKEFMIGVFEKERPKWICHMAARAGVRPSIQDPFVYIHSNIKGTTQLMDLCVQFGGCENFVFASSSSVYGENQASIFSETDAVDHPVSPYAASKRACELLAYTYHHLYKLNITGLRFFTVYGPRGRPDMAPYKFIDRCSRGLAIEQYGDGSSSRDYTYIDDIVDGVVRAIDRPYPYEIFNLGKGSGTSLKEFLVLVEKHVGKSPNIRILPNQPGDVPYTCANIDKAKLLLGYNPKFSFEEGIRRTVDWYKTYESSKLS